MLAKLNQKASIRLEDCSFRSPPYFTRDSASETKYTGDTLPGNAGTDAIPIHFRLTPIRRLSAIDKNVMVGEQLRSDASSNNKAIFQSQNFFKANNSSISILDVDGEANVTDFDVDSDGFVDIEVNNRNSKPNNPNLIIVADKVLISNCGRGENY